MPIEKDPRWILLAETGEYSTLGRYREPDEQDIAAAEVALKQNGLSGWIAIMSHSVYQDAIPELVMVRALCDPQTPFALAVQAFRDRI